MSLFSKAVELIKAEDTLRETGRVGKNTQQDADRVKAARKAYDAAKGKK